MRRRRAEAREAAPRGVPERLSASWPWGPDPVKSVLFLLLIPPLLFAGAFGAMGWSWWERTLAGAGGLSLTGLVVLALLGAWRVRRDRGPRRADNG